ncbi:MAG: hypothetical protein ACLSTO_10130, partial [Bilophila wadsworthia]
VEILDSQKERVELGAGSSADVTQTKGRLARAQSTLTDAEASLREGEASYIRLTGKPVPASLAEVYVPEPMYTGYDAVMEVADKNNPKLKAYMSDIKAARGRLAESAYHQSILASLLLRPQRPRQPVDFRRGRRACHALEPVQQRGGQGRNRSRRVAYKDGHGDAV